MMSVHEFPMLTTKEYFTDESCYDYLYCRLWGDEWRKKENIPFLSFSTAIIQLDGISKC